MTAILTDEQVRELLESAAISVQPGTIVVGDHAARKALQRAARLGAEIERGQRTGHKLDTDRQVFFYEQEFYVLSNFSAFCLYWSGHRFDTSEAAYQWSKFDHELGSTADMLAEDVRNAIHAAPSAHVAFKLAESNKHLRRADWDAIKVNVMRNILIAKVQQHEYVRRKLLETGDRELIEDSWRDDFWGWGPHKDGQNMLGKLWMEVRAAIRARAGKEGG